MSLAVASGSHYTSKAYSYMILFLNRTKSTSFSNYIPPSSKASSDDRIKYDVIKRTLEGTVRLPPT